MWEMEWGETCSSLVYQQMSEFLASSAMFEECKIDRGRPSLRKGGKAESRMRLG